MFLKRNFVCVLVIVIETIFPGFIAGLELESFFIAAAAYNASHSESLEAFAIKTGFSIKEIV